MKQEKPLVELINEHLSGDLHNLPVFHSVAVKLQQMLSKREFHIDEVIERISEDQSLASKVLKVANSSFYAGLSKVATIKDAVVRLGAQEVANLAMVASQLEIYKSDNSILSKNMNGLWSHALSCAVGAKWLAQKSGYVNLAPEAFMGALLHDIGKLAILKVLDDIHNKKETTVAFSETLINEVMTRMHEEVGLRLLQAWSLPECYGNIALNHHREDFDNNDILLILVRLANLACKKAGKDLTPDPGLSLIAAPEAHCLGVKEITLAELEILIEDADNGLDDC
jgi:putative nucleotidyltransferase with HDIG domain